MDIRWKQRFANYQRALGRLRMFFEKPDLNDLERQGLVKAFEYTYELAWNVMKDFLTWQGHQGVFGSRDAIGGAFRAGIIVSGEVWMEMFKDRNIAVHAYDEEAADKIAEAVKAEYIAAFENLEQTMLKLL